MTQYYERFLNTIDKSQIIYDYINPKKQPEVKKILDSPIPDYVEGIILFGSAVTTNATQASDVDLAIVCNDSLDEPIPWIDEAVDYDLLHYKSVEDFLRQTETNQITKRIYERGVVIWKSPS